VGAVFSVLALLALLRTPALPARAA